MITITSPASTLQLLTAAQLRLAAGLAENDLSLDSVLTPLGLRVAAEIAQECGVAIGVGHAPTLNKERITQTFRIIGRRTELILARRHDVAIISVTLDGTLLEATDYEVDPEAGLLYRLSGDARSWWSGSKAIVVYDAGFATVPDDLAGVASDLVRVRRSEGSRDPSTKGVTTEIPDVITTRTDYWVGSVPGQSGGAIPADISARLSRYRNVAIG